MGVNEFDHLPDSARRAWKDIAKRTHTALSYYRRRCRQLAFELDVERARCKALDRENALLTAQVDVLRMALESPRGVVRRPREES